MTDEQLEAVIVMCAWIALLLTLTSIISMWA